MKQLIILIILILVGCEGTTVYQECEEYAVLSVYVDGDSVAYSGDSIYNGCE